MIHAVGFDDPIPRLSRKSAVGERLGVTRALVLDELAKRIDSDDVEVWLESGVHYIVPSVSKDKTLAVIALGRKESGEPLSSEDLSLLEAVAAQVATALENGRLYGQLRAKAEELDRLRELSENVIESLNDGLAVVGLDDRVIRWNQGLEKLYGVERKEAIGQHLASLFDPSVVHI
ncbi:MAG TPA: GAF domain-containing sensor histidine kinase, partial [Acidobacteria bacterium]|nr:GAF domain-containing sensor histidine kinase [Acidobacteriota bacterium]